MPRGAVNLDLTFRALADPTRRAMVERLARGQASVSELARPYDMSLPAIRVRTFTVVPAALSLAEKWFNQRRAQWEQRLDRLGEHLKQFPDGEPN